MNIRLTALLLAVALSSCSTGGAIIDTTLTAIEACAGDPECVQAVKDEIQKQEEQATGEPPAEEEPPVIEEPVEPADPPVVDEEPTKPVEPPVVDDPVVTGCAEEHLPDNYGHTAGRTVVWTTDTCSADNVYEIPITGTSAPVAGMLSFDITNFNACESYAERETFLTWLKFRGPSGRELNLHHLLWGGCSLTTAFVVQHFNVEPFYEKQSRHNGPNFDPGLTYRVDIQWTEYHTYSQIWSFDGGTWTHVANYDVSKPDVYSSIEMVRVGNGAYPATSYPSLATPAMLSNIRLSILE